MLDQGLRSVDYPVYAADLYYTSAAIYLLDEAIDGQAGINPSQIHENG
ncbi:hypothetical protein JKG47_23075 [Acidithiobacillus sp. MC6.1]|nr:hypothetical protein [Acidithiobacillus sp. MC6.1]